MGNQSFKKYIIINSIWLIGQVSYSIEKMGNQSFKRKEHIFIYHRRLSAVSLYCHAEQKQTLYKSLFKLQYDQLLEQGVQKNNKIKSN